MLVCRWIAFSGQPRLNWKLKRKWHYPSSLLLCAAVQASNSKHSLPLKKREGRGLKKGLHSFLRDRNHPPKNRTKAVIRGILFMMCQHEIWVGWWLKWKLITCLWIIWPEFTERDALAKKFLKKSMWYTTVAKSEGVWQTKLFHHVNACMCGDCTLSNFWNGHLFSLTGL